jgi:hypothetical protein
MEIKMTHEAAVVILMDELRALASLARDPKYINEIKFRANYTIKQIEAPPVIRNNRGRQLSACEVALACNTDTYRSVEEKVAEDHELVQTDRGRRYVVCTAKDNFIRAIRALPVSDDMKRELTNQIVALMRTILIINDGHVSDSKLNQF